MWPRAAAAYDCAMDASTTDLAPQSRFATAGVVLDALAAHDFAALADAMEGDATLRALLPGGYREFVGAEAICAAFDKWFGDTSTFEVTDASAGQFGELLDLRWRIRLTSERFPASPMIVEQHVYASTAPSGRIARGSLLCTGFWPDEHR
jgi:hypothetical protein